MESPHKIFLIPEVLEQALVELDATTLLLSQRVCHLWNSLIKTSPTLQRALFFRPERQPPTEDQNPKRTTNPFMDKLLKHFISNPTSVNGTQDSSNWFRLFIPLQTTNHQKLGRKQHPYSRPEASWREMLLDQPPTPSIAVRDDLMPLRTFGVLCDERKSVLRLKHLETLVQVCFLLPVGNILIFYPMQSRPLYRAPVSGLRRSLENRHTYIMPRSFRPTRLSAAGGDASMQGGRTAGLPWLIGVMKWLKESGWGCMREIRSLEYALHFMDLRFL
ncbi:hypothetical protein ABZX51_008746 [Aspergillus tubingensis]